MRSVDRDRTLYLIEWWGADHEKKMLVVSAQLHEVTRGRESVSAQRWWNPDLFGHLLILLSVSSEVALLKEGRKTVTLMQNNTSVSIHSAVFPVLTSYYCHTCFTTASHCCFSCFSKSSLVLTMKWAIFCCVNIWGPHSHTIQMQHYVKQLQKTASVCSLRNPWWSEIRCNTYSQRQAA